MSGELKPKITLAVGQELVARWKYPRHDHANESKRAVVVKVSRVWAEAKVDGWSNVDRVERFRIASGHGDEHCQFIFVSPEHDAYEARVRAAWDLLLEHGLSARFSQLTAKLHDEDLFAIADLLAARDGKDA